MAFITLDDLYGSSEIIVFDSVFSRNYGVIVEENIVLIEGRLSIREDEPTKIIASNIKIVEEDKLSDIEKVLVNITFLEEDKKSKLREFIKVYRLNNANIKISVIDNNIEKPCGFINLDNKNLVELENIVGKENIKLI